MYVDFTPPLIDNAAKTMEVEMRGTVGAIFPPVVDKTSRGQCPFSTFPSCIFAAFLLFLALLLLLFDSDIAVLSVSLKGGDVAGLLLLLEAVTW